MSVYSTEVFITTFLSVLFTCLFFVIVDMRPKYVHIHHLFQISKSIKKHLIHAHYNQ